MFVIGQLPHADAQHVVQQRIAPFLRRAEFVLHMAVGGRQTGAAKRVMELMENDISPMVAQHGRRAIRLAFWIVFEGGFHLAKSLRRSLQGRLSRAMNRIATDGVMLKFAFHDRQFVFLPCDCVKEAFRRGENNLQIFCFRGKFTDLADQRLPCGMASDEHDSI